MATVIPTKHIPDEIVIDNGSVEEPLKPRGKKTRSVEITFFDRLRQLTDDEWDKHKVYIYRRFPRINKSDSPHYISTVRQAIDEDWLRENHGSGRYSLRLNDQKGTVDSYVAEIQDINFPPKVRPEEVIDCAENERFFQLWPSEKPMVGGDAANADADTTAVKELTGILKTLISQKGSGSDGLRDTLVGWALEQTSKEREVNGPTQIAGLLRELKELVPSPPAVQPQADPLLMMDRVLTLTEKLNRNQAEPKRNGLEDMKELLGLVGTIKETFGAGGDGIAGGREDESILRTILSSLPGVLQGVAAVADRVMAGVSMAKGLSNGLSGFPMPIMAGPNNSTAGAGGGLNGLAQQGNAGEVPNQPMANAGTAEAGLETAVGSLNGAGVLNPQLLGQLVQVSQLAIGALNRGMTGGEFADSFVNTFGEIPYSFVVNLGKEQILNAVKGIPEVNAQLGMIEPQFVQFLDEFLAGPSEYEEGEPEEKLK